MAPIDPVILTVGTSVAKALLRSWLESGVNERLENAKQKYLTSTRDRTSPFEIKRQELLAKLSGLQTEVILSVVTPKLAIKLLALIVEQITLAYQARIELELTQIELTIGRIEGTLGKYKELQQNRQTARLLAIAVSVGAIAGLVVLIIWASSENGPSSNDIFPIIEVPLPVVIWSAIGSFTAVFYRFNKSGDIELQDPLRWLFTRPLTGIVMGIVAYFIMKIGLLSLTGVDNVDINASEILWLVAFLSGFSDRFADSLLTLLVGKFGGNTEEELVTVEQVDSLWALDGLQSLVDSFPRIGSKKDTEKSKEAATPHVSPPPQNGKGKEEKPTHSPDEKDIMTENHYVKVNQIGKREAENPVDKTKQDGTA